MTREGRQMLTHTTARGLQEEMVRRASRFRGSRGDGVETVVRIDHRRISTAVASVLAALAVVAVTAMTSSHGPADQSPAIQVNEVRGGTSAAVLKGD
jgi:hypothetical protein